MVEPVVWSPVIDPGVVVLGEVPGAFSKSSTDKPLPVMALSHVREAPDAVYAFTTLAPPIPIVLPPGTSATDGLGVMILPDPLELERIDALMRFLHARHGKHAPADPRLTPGRRQRLVFVLRALDGRKQAATHHEIAEVLLGAERLDSEAWQVSSHRDWIKRLLREGRRLVHGGYLGLMRHRRPRGSL